MILKIVSGAVVAIALAVVLAGASIRGIAAWKIVLAVAGVVLIILGERTTHRDSMRARPNRRRG